MSKVTKFDITLGKPNGIYHPGEIVSGQVSITARRDIPIHGKCHWRIQGGDARSCTRVGNLDPAVCLCFVCVRMSVNHHLHLKCARSPSSSPAWSGITLKIIIHACVERGQEMMSTLTHHTHASSYPKFQREGTSSTTT